MLLAWDMNYLKSVLESFLLEGEQPGVGNALHAGIAKDFENWLVVYG